MIGAVADTHAVIWYITDDARLSRVARDGFESQIAQGRTIGVCSITFLEIVYLQEKHRILDGTFDSLMERTRRPNSALTGIPFDSVIVHAMQRLPRNDILDMPDRMIAATALYLGLPLISRDGKIRLSSVTTIW